ncbi:MAG: VanZ family protein [Pseudomonadota bacterium]
MASYSRRRHLWLLSSLGLATGIAALTLTGPTAIRVPAVGSDKVYHAIAFAMLVLPTAVLKPDRLTLVTVLAFGYGVMLEAVQPLVGRTMELADILANTVGILAAYALGKATQHFLDTFWRR